MGQKVNPFGLRLGILYNWKSRWFFTSKRTYKDTLISDIKIRQRLMKKFSYASVTQIDIERAIKKITVIIYSVKPGMIIGRGGKGLEEVKKFIVDEMKAIKNKEVKIDIKIEPVKKPYTNAFFVAQAIGEKLVRNFPHRSLVHNVMNRAMEAGVKGIKVQLGGRIAGAEISRRETYKKGSMPLSTLREEIDFVAMPSLTKSGYIGVKVWICK